MIAGYKKSDLEKVLSLTGVAYDGTLKDLVQQTQKNWIRPVGKERWELAPLHEDKRESLLPLFKKMGLVDEWKPSHSSYDHVLFLGAHFSRMIIRATTLRDLLPNPSFSSSVVYLSGFRIPAPDEKKLWEEKGWGPSPEREIHFFPRLFEEKGVESKKMKCVEAAETKRSDGTTYRSTTVDTMKKWATTILQEPGHIVVISNQPFCHYQKMVAQTTLPACYDIEVVGAQAPEDTLVAVYLDTLARTLYQWAQTQK